MSQVETLHGTRRPRHRTPPRTPGSIRRTTTIDGLYPEGLDGPLLVVGRARDLVTTLSGRAKVIAAARLRVEVQFCTGPTIAAIEIEPEVPGADALIGKTPSKGFRGLIDDTTSATRGSLAYLLLDDLPVATLVSGYARHSLGPVRPQESNRRPPGPALQFPNLCAGYQVGGVIVTSLERDVVQPVSSGPTAPGLAGRSDPVAWHGFPTLDANGVRRRRRQDVSLRDGVIMVNAFFRDSYMGPDGVETVIHEYTVTAAVDSKQMSVIQCKATPRVLPWRECPQAAASAARLAGMSVIGLRRQIRDELVGPTTCTHLNDTLRGLEDVEYLVRTLQVSG